MTRLPLRLALLAAGVGTMWLESRFQPAPGVGFAIALAFMLAAVMIGATKEIDHD